MIIQFNYIRVKMGNQGFSQYKLQKKEWIQVTINGKTYIKNIITFENFQFKILQQYEKHQHTAQLIQRSIYNMPKTPKTIILSQKQSQVHILVQASSQRVRDVIPKVQFFTDLLQIIKSLICTAQSLYKKYGSFKITESMIGFTENTEVIMWLNSEFEKSNIQYPQQSRDPQFQLINSIINIVNCYAPFKIKDLLNNKFRTFNSFLINLNSLLAQYKAGKMKTKFKSTQKDKTFSPTNNLLLQSPTYIKNNINLKGENNQIEKIKSQRNVPQFIKKQINKNNQQKISLLKSIPHKRTVTIEQLHQSRLNFKGKHIENNKKESQIEAKIENIKSIEKQYLTEEIKAYQCHKLNFTSSTQISQKQWIKLQNQTFNKNQYISPIIYDQLSNQHQIHKQDQKFFNQSSGNSILPYESFTAPRQIKYKHSFPSIPTNHLQTSHSILFRQFNEIFEPLTDRNERSFIITGSQSQNIRDDEQSIKFYRQ